jgi:hypothetical protein
LIDGAGIVSGTIFCELAWQPSGDWTVTESVTGSVVAESKTIERVPAPDVIAPPVIIQLYVDAAPASGTSAAFPPVEGQTLAGAVIVAEGGIATVTVACAEVVAGQAPACTTAR